MRAPRRSLTVLLVGAGILAWHSPVLSGNNPRFTLPMHAESRAAPSHPAPCNWYLPVDCEFPNRPVVNLPLGGQRYWNIYFFVYKHTEATGVNAAFAWDPSWTLLGGKWSCQPGQITTVAPQEPGGSEAGQLLTSFDCVTDPRLLVVGRMAFNVGPVGCLELVNPRSPGLIQAIDCNLDVDAIDANSLPGEQRLGRICREVGGFIACDVPVGDMAPVKRSTWGRLKNAHR